MTAPNLPGLPLAEEWAKACHLKKSGREWIGPCPLCGGTDRFHVRDGSNGACVGCRGCIDGQGSDVRAGRFGEILRAVFPERCRNRPPREKAARMPQNRRTRTAPDAHPGKKTRPDPLWAAAGRADESPARRYLANRFTWPPEGIGPDLPDSVRWLSREAAPGTEESWNGTDSPLAWRGAAVFAWRTCNGELSGVSMEGLDTDGRRPDQTERGKRWRRVFGSRTGAGFAVGIAGGDPLVLVEGEADALACTWLYPAAEVWAIGGTSGAALGAAIPHGRRVIIEADPNPSGRKAALKLDAALDGRARIEWNRNGQDPADVWKAEFLDRAARFEFDGFDGGLDRTAAEKAAWDGVLKNQE